MTLSILVLSPPWRRLAKFVTVATACFFFWHYGIVYGLLGMRPEHHITTIFRQRVKRVATDNATIVYDTGYVRQLSIQKDYDGAVVGRINDAQKRKEIVSQIIHKNCSEQDCTPWSTFSAIGKGLVPGSTKEAFKGDIMSTAFLYGPGWPIHLPTPARFEASSLIDQAISAPHSQCMFYGWIDYFCLDVEGGAFVYRYRW